MLREHKMASLSTKLPSSELLKLLADKITHISHKLIFTALSAALFNGVLCEVVKKYVSSCIGY